jgi:threonine synthase
LGYASVLQCKECGREYPLDPTNVCEFCFGPLEVQYDYENIAKVVTKESIQNGPNSMWRYKELLPVAGDNIVNINSGFTPLLKAHRLGEELGLTNLYLKNDCVNPTHSFKDRVVTVAATKAKEFGFDTIACASTGNLAGSVAAHAAKAGMRCFVFIPADLETGKIIGAAVYGPTLVAVKGSYDEVNRLCSEVADRHGWAFVNINIRPYYSEGSKSLGYEVAEQLGWKTPDHAIVPAASGSLFTKIWKGFKEFKQLGLIATPETRMHLATYAGSPIVTAYNEGTKDVRPIKPQTIAKSLAIGNPADGYYALNTIEETNGSATAVSDKEVVDGMLLLAQTEGIFGETAGGVTIASLRRLVKQGKINRDDLTVAYITGSGLKTQEAVEHVVQPLHVEPTLSSFEDALKLHTELFGGNKHGASQI